MNLNVKQNLLITELTTKAVSLGYYANVYRKTGTAQEVISKGVTLPKTLIAHVLNSDANYIEFAHDGSDTTSSLTITKDDIAIKVDEQHGSLANSWNVYLDAIKQLAAHEIEKAKRAELVHNINMYVTTKVHDSIVDALAEYCEAENLSIDNFDFNLEVYEA